MFKGFEPITMEILLINPNPGGKGLNEATIEPPLGLGYMAAVLEQNDYRCSIIDANLLGLKNEKVINDVPDKVGIVGMYCNSFTYNSVKDLSEKVRQKVPDAFIVIGGPLPSAAPEIVLKEIDCDCVVRGEGEYSLLKIVNNINKNYHAFKGDISGLGYIDEDGKVILNPVERIKDLDSLPFPAIHLLPPLKFYKSRSRKKPVCAIMTSRGCAFDCSFCSKDIFQRKVTFRSAESVLSEIDYLVKKFGVRQIDIMDDNFAQKKGRLNDILDGLIQRKYDLAINMQSGIRTESLDEAMLKKMKKAGIYKLAFGVESADPDVLKLHNKQLNLGKLEEMTILAKKMGFMVYGFFIIGLPGETEAAFKRTIEFVKRLDFDVANFCMAVPFNGTELYKMVEEKGRFLIDTTRNIDSGFYDGKVFFEYGENDAATISKRYQRAYKEFYTIPKQLKMIFKIRSIHELVWLKDAIMFVLIGVLKKTNNALSD